MGSWLRLLQDPAPEFVFELSQEGLAWARSSAPRQQAFEPLPPDVISVSPLRDNIQRPEVLGDAVARIVSPNGTRKRRRSVLILPDYCARVAVLEFDAFPSSAEEQLALVKFRMKKSVPFDVESAIVKYHAQPAGEKRFDVVVVVAALEIVARYEAPFRAAGLHPGVVTTSAMAAASLEKPEGVAVLAKLSGRALTVTVSSNGVLKLMRCLELSGVDAEEIVGVLYPTLAYIEDELAARPSRLVACGLERFAPALEEGLGIKPEILRGKFGVPTAYNAGLLGFLEDMAA